ncbi:MAG: hypothetical protein U1F30_02545 [Steroidobacteraceae bacterium]
MRRFQTLLATLILATASLAAGIAVAAEPASPPATASQPTTPAPDANKITKSRSNIQNNRQSAPGTAATDPAAGDPQQLVKPKTKSNQSND